MAMNSDNPLSRILNLRLGAVARSEEAYQKYYDLRRTRLQEQRPDSAIFGALFDAAVQQTESAHGGANALAAACETLIAAAPSGEREAIDRISQTMQRVSKKTLPQQSALVTEHFNDIHTKAYRYFSDIILTPHDNPDAYLNDVIDAAIKEETEFDRPLIRLRIALLWKQYETMGDHLRIGMTLRSLAALYRGILYSGIMNELGDDIDRNELQNAVDSLGDAIVDEVIPIPLKGLIEALVNVFVLVLGLGGKPDAILQAEGVENYINNYCGILEGWMQSAERLQHALDELARVVQSS